MNISPLQEDLNKTNEGHKAIKRQTGSWIALIVPWWQATRAILPLFFLSRLLLLLLSYFTVVLFTLPNYTSEVVSPHALLYSWYRWDVVRFTTIAANGYISTEYTAFFPLYPWLERVVGTLLDNDVYLAGILIANLAWLGTQIMLYRLVEREFDRDMAGRTVLYLTFFPTAFFFFVAYNESLFLLFLLLSVYAMRQSHWWLAGISGGLATLTRSAGLILSVVFVYEFGRQRLPLWQHYLQMWQTKQIVGLLKQFSGLVAVLLIPAGLGIYASYLNRQFHDPLAFLHAQAHWRSGLTPPWSTIISAINVITNYSVYTFVASHTWVDLSMLLFFMLLLLLCFIGPLRFARQQWSLALVGILMLLYPLLYPGLYNTPLASMERFVLELFAAFIVLARLGRHQWWHQSYLILTLPFLAFFWIQFITNHWTV